MVMPGRGRQLSLFSAGVSPADVSDLDGLLCGPAQLTRRGAGARLSLLVAATWREEALRAELAERGLPAESVPVDAATSVRTGFEPALTPLAVRWSGASGKRAPTGLTLDGARLRLWCIAAGGPGELAGSWVLGLGHSDLDVWLPVGAALAMAGLTAALIGPRVSGPAYRLTGSRRLTRLVELVGPPPAGCPQGMWPA